MAGDHGFGFTESESAADGSSVPAERELQHLGLLTPGTGGSARPAAVRVILADNGPNWHFFGDANTNLPDAVTQAVDTVPASAFQAVDESSLEISPTRGKPASSASP